MVVDRNFESCRTYNDLLFPAMKHSHYMKLAFREAEAALNMGEVPVGAVVVAEGEVVGRGHNLRETTNDPTAHAEILALREASEKMGRWRLAGADIYITLEPCSMCAGAITLARVDRLVYGASDPKAGACGSIFDIVGDHRLNHRPEIIRGVLEDECREILKTFFKGRRGEEP